jgi:hypothetical protein
MYFPPLIPGRDPLLEPCEMLLVCHCLHLLRPPMGIEANLLHSVHCLLQSDRHYEPASFHTSGKDVMTYFAPQLPLLEAEVDALALGLPLARGDEVGAEGARDGALLLQGLPQEPGGDFLP